MNSLIRKSLIMLKYMVYKPIINELQLTNKAALITENFL